MSQYSSCIKVEFNDIEDYSYLDIKEAILNSLLEYIFNEKFEFVEACNIFKDFDKTFFEENNFNITITTDELIAPQHQYQIDIVLITEFPNVFKHKKYESIKKR